MCEQKEEGGGGRRSAHSTHLFFFSRLCVLILVGVGIAWIPIVQSITELFHYIQAITSFLAPPICAVYVLAIFWKRTNEIVCGCDVT